MDIQAERISELNTKGVRKGEWVLYWMQQSQRAHDNPALEYAIDEANRLDLPVLVLFVLTDDYPEANGRHYRFMLEGLADTRKLLAKRRIGLVVRKGSVETVVPLLSKEAALLVCDVGYTRHQRLWRQCLAQSVSCRTVAVEGDVVVPVRMTSGKREYAARTIRPKIQRQIQQFLVPFPRYRPRYASVETGLESLDPENIEGILGQLAIDMSVPPVSVFFKGGPSEAKKRLRRFIRKHLVNYEKNRNQPQTDDISQMSPYLHFGQIAPVRLALEIEISGMGTDKDRAAYLEELIVRRELAINFVFYTDDHDRYTCLPDWARKTLATHETDRRKNIYDRRELEDGHTHDPYWNAAMSEMRDTGFMHNYMRMYWGKKILEWSSSPQTAYETAIYLNNRYFLDGRDPNSYAGIGWIFGLHDRAWFQREIFGTVRYMAASGLERKCDIGAYVDKVRRLGRLVRER